MKIFISYQLILFFNNVIFFGGGKQNMEQRFFRKRTLVFSMIMWLFITPVVFAYVVVTKQTTISQKEFLTMF